jgi:phosphatidylglycerophosphatase A
MRDSLILVLRNREEWLDRVTVCIATGGYCGYIRFVPATIGSFVGLMLYLPMATSPVLVQLTIVGGFLGLGIWASGHAEKLLKTKDARPIVIDEIVGMWISVLFLPHLISYLLAAFILFRLFDVIKPFPAKKAEHLKGGWGIMLDDVIAGLYTNALLHSVQAFEYY